MARAAEDRKEKVDMVGVSGKVGVAIGALQETSTSVRDLGCNTNQFWQIEAENKFIERLLGSSQNYWEGWRTRLRNWEQKHITDVVC